MVSKLLQSSTFHSSFRIIARKDGWGGYGKQTPYGGVVWDSTWEAELAKRLDSIGVRWVRPDTSLSVSYEWQGRSRRYYPDFWLPDFEVYLEVKAFMTDQVEAKIKACFEQHKPLFFLMSLEEIYAYTPP